MWRSVGDAEDAYTSHQGVEVETMHVNRKDGAIVMVEHSFCK